MRAILAGRSDVALVETHAPGEARELAARAVARGSLRVIAGGGDGTVNEVVNGLIVDERAGATLAIVPLGTGNDLARSLSLPTDADAALALALDGATRALDLIAAESEGRTHYG